MDHVLEIYALFMLLGVFSTTLIKETKRKTLEELSADGDDDMITSGHSAIASQTAPHVSTFVDDSKVVRSGNSA